MKKQDFMFTIGYQGDSAIIDAQARKKFAKLSLQELNEKGLYKPAFCAALFDGDENGMQTVLQAYNEGLGTDYSDIDNLKRLFGVFGVPENIVKTIEIK